MHLKSYKDKVIYILQKTIDSQDLETMSGDAYTNYVPDLKWCIHVIKNDFLQISNSMQTTTNSQSGRQRRFSKTQKSMIPLE